MNDEFKMTNGEINLKAGSNVSGASARSPFVLRPSSFVILSIALALLSLPSRVLACATCYGASDSPLAQGMNWGIITLLGFIGSVLAGIVIFFAYIIRRAARLEAAAHSQIQTAPHP
jgi:hypothetical protein